MATWNDIEKNLNNLDVLDTEMLRAFSKVSPPASQNPAFHARFADAKQQIRDILQDRAKTSLGESEEKTNVKALLRRFQNNPYLAVIIVFGIVVIGIGSFTDALSKIRNFAFGSNSKSQEVRFRIPSSQAFVMTTPASQAVEDLQLKSVVTSGLNDADDPVDELTEIPLESRYLWIWSRSIRFVRGRTYHYRAEVFDGGSNLVWEAEDEFEPPRMTWNAWGRFRIDPNRNLPGVWELRVDLNGSKSVNHLIVKKPETHPSP